MQEATVPAWPPSLEGVGVHIRDHSIKRNPRNATTNAIALVLDCGWIKGLDRLSCNISSQLLPLITHWFPQQTPDDDDDVYYLISLRTAIACLPVRRAWQTTSLPPLLAALPLRC